LNIYSVIALKLRGLSVLRGVRSNPLIKAFSAALEAQNAFSFASAYGELCLECFSHDASQEILNAVHFDINPLNSTANPSPALLSAASQDINSLNDMLGLESNSLKTFAAEIFSAPALFELPELPRMNPLPFSSGEELLSFYKRKGFGFFARASAFTVRDDGTIDPVADPDPVRLSELPGYERHKRQIIRNTLAFLDGHEANNILLYGDKGTGKSSTVKAIANEYAERGLKIIDLPPRCVRHFPAIFEMVRHAPFRFLLFLDDLSFSREDENFASLKAFIEGGIAQRPSNLVIYATSNRRHLIRESSADRQGDEVRVRDALETAASLSDRFGLEITFSVPDRDEYLYIVGKLAEEAGLQLSEDKLQLLAERFALRRNGRSPRTARQFILQQLAELYNVPGE